MGLKDMFVQAGMWQLQVVSVPRNYFTPVQSPEMLNENLLHLFFGPNLGELPTLPRDVALYVQDPNMTGKIWTRIAGPPPNQSSSFLFDHSPFQTWYLQGRAQWSYAMLLILV
jgi:hypothetical protein